MHTVSCIWCTWDLVYKYDKKNHRLQSSCMYIYLYEKHIYLNMYNNLYISYIITLEDLLKPDHFFHQVHKLVTIPYPVSKINP